MIQNIILELTVCKLYGVRVCGRRAHKYSNRLFKKNERPVKDRN